jgi:hypothetical protein
MSGACAATRSAHRHRGPYMRPPGRRPFLAALLFAFAPLPAACTEAPVTTVVLVNDYPPSRTNSLLVYSAYWQAVSFQGPVPPGSSSTRQETVPASANTAYVVLAPGWDPESPTPPTSFVILESRNGFGVQEGDMLDMPVDDTTFTGNCVSGSFLSQSQADFISEIVFPSIFAKLRYDAPTCRTTPIGDSGGP